MPHDKPVIKILAEDPPPLVGLKAPTINAIFASCERQRAGHFFLEEGQMTQGDVLVTVLAKITGHPKTTVEELLETFKAHFDGPQKFDAKMTAADAQTLHDDLMQEQEGIRGWLTAAGLM